MPFGRAYPIVTPFRVEGCVFIGYLGGLIAAVDCCIGVLCAHADIDLINLINPKNIDLFVGLQIKDGSWIRTDIFD